MNQILANIEAIRKEKGLKQAVMAERLGMAQSSYSRYFTDADDMKLSMLLQISDILEVSLVDIITWPEKYVPQDEGTPNCEECRKKDEIIENLNLLIRQLRLKK